MSSCPAMALWLSCIATCCARVNSRSVYSIGTSASPASAAALTRWLPERMQNRSTKKESSSSQWASHVHRVTLPGAMTS